MSHLKKEKSRDAARSRRGKENNEFYELAKLLPISNETSGQLDKASIIRLTMSYLQLRNFFQAKVSCVAAFESGSSDNGLSGLVQSNVPSLLCQALDGFLMVLNKTGRCLYISDTVSEFLGLAQVDVIGNSILNYMHPDDSTELMNHLENRCCENEKRKFCQPASVPDEEESCSCSFFLRMKSSLPRRGMSVKTSGYKVVRINGCVCRKNSKPVEDGTSAEDSEKASKHENLLGFAGIGEVLPSPTIGDLQLHECMFVTRLNASLCINYCEDRIKNLTDYDSSELTGSTLYQFIHTSDLNKIRKCHVELLTKGQVITPYYRWLTKAGGYLWVQSSVALLLDKHQNGDEDVFVWITCILRDGKESLNACVQSNGIKGSVTSNSEKDDEPCAKPSFEVDCHSSLPKAVSERKETDGMKNSEAPKKCEDSNEPIVKFTKQLPDKSSALKRSHITNTSESVKEPVYKQAAVKRERIDQRNSRELDKDSTRTGDVQGKSSTADDVLDVNSTMWHNPPNREVTNHSDLNTTVTHHHYPYGINPNVLNSNPLFAKIFTEGYANYEALMSPRNAYVLAPPILNFFTPVLNPVPQVVPARADINCCPSSVISIIDELRKDPMRKVNPPNKVVLTNSHIPYNKLVMPTALVGVNNHISHSLGVASSGHSLAVDSLHRQPVLTMPDKGIIFTPLTDCAPPGSSTPLVLQPLNLVHNPNALNSLPI